MNTIHTKRVQAVLSKGIDMTTNDIKYLIKREISYCEIAQALDMDANSYEFRKLIYNITKSKLKNYRTSTMRLKITPEEYLKFRQNGLSLRDIARVKKSSVASITKWKYLHGIRDMDLVKAGLLRLDQIYGKKKKARV